MADGAYRTDGYGTFALDSGSLTIPPEARWDFIDSPDAGIGVLAGYRTGRTDNNPGFTSADDGSTRLRGVPNVGAALDVGVTGHVTALGVPVFGQVRSAKNGKAAARFTTAWTRTIYNVATGKKGNTFRLMTITLAKCLSKLTSREGRVDCEFH